MQKLCREATCGKKRLNGFFFFPYIASLHNFADKNTLSLNQCMGLQKFLNQEAEVILITLMKIKSLIIMKNLILQIKVKIQGTRTSNLLSDVKMLGFRKDHKLNFIC